MPIGATSGRYRHVMTARKADDSVRARRSFVILLVVVTLGVACSQGSVTRHVVVSCSPTTCTKDELATVKRQCADKSVRQVKITENDPSGGVLGFETIFRCPSH